MAMDPQLGNCEAQRVLIVDDEPVVRQFVSRALRHAGFTVTTAEDGLDALERLDRHPVDLLITDIVMPGLDGIELALTASKKHPALAIVLMTGYSRELQRAFGLEKVIHQVISKPFSLREIQALARQALGVRCRPAAPARRVTRDPSALR